jgi:hypothetical protein
MTVLTVVFMPRKDELLKHPETEIPAGVPRDFIKCGSSPGRFEVVFWEPMVPLEKFTRGGREVNPARDRSMAEEFLRKRGKSELSDTGLMERIGKHQNPKIGRSASIKAIKRGCKAIVDEHATSKTKEDTSQGRLSVVQAAAQSWPG